MNPPVTARVRARVRGFSLDAEMAAGRPIDGDPARKLRAERLSSAEVRQRLAARLQGIASDPQAPPRFAASVPVDRRAVEHARAFLLGLSERLLGPEPVHPRGIAMVQRLLTDGASPLYFFPIGADERPAELEYEARAAAVALDGGL